MNNYSDLPFETACLGHNQAKRSTNECESARTGGCKFEEAAVAELAQVLLRINSKKPEKTRPIATLSVPKCKCDACKRPYSCQIRALVFKNKLFSRASLPATPENRRNGTALGPHHSCPDVTIYGHKANGESSLAAGFVILS